MRRNGVGLEHFSFYSEIIARGDPRFALKNKLTSVRPSLYIFINSTSTKSNYFPRKELYFLERNFLKTGERFHQGLITVIYL